MTPPRSAVESRAQTLTAAVETLQAVVGEVAPELHAHVRETGERIAEGRFHVSVVGEFKRGKSTLVDALLGREVLPVGVLPLTAVPVEITHGDERATVEFADGEWVDIDLHDLDEYVTEQRNPGNSKGVARVRVAVPSSLLATGLVLVDTPGLGSVHEHNTDAAVRALEATDGAIVVLSATAPFSEQERELMERLRERSARTFFALNRVDELDADGLREVEGFVTDELHRWFGDGAAVYPMSARRALDAAVNGADPDPGFDAFVADLRAFVEDGLATSQLAVAQRALVEIAERVESTVEMEAAALELTVDELDERLARFDAEGERQRQALEEDRVLLDHAVDRIADTLAGWLRRIGEEIPPGAHERIDAAASRARTAEIDDAVEDEVAAIVAERFDEVRAEVAHWTQQAWYDAAADFAARVEHRATAVREAAEDLLDIPVRPLPVPEVADVDDEFTYQLERIPHTGEDLGRMLRRLMPSGWVRQRAASRGRRRLAEILDKHAGRARYDLVRRLSHVRDAFAAELTAHLDELSTGVRAAAGRARERRRDAGAELDAERRRIREVRARTAEVRRAVAEVGR